jgi:hypothetical protein
MLNKVLERQFERIGARVKTGPLSHGDLRINVLRDRRGEYFDLRINEGVVRDVFAMNASPKDRHLLLLAKTEGERGVVQKQRFLCGHDEKTWFVAAIPGTASTVASAMEALKPALVRQELVRKRVRSRARNRRKNKAFVRQGEWFFIPVQNLVVSGQVRRHEPLQRGAGKPHWCEFLYGTGGEKVYVSPQHPNGVMEERYAQLLSRKPSLRKLRWELRRRNAGVYVKGRVSHPDHRTIHLNGWHQVVMNTENQAPAMRHVAFID